MEGKNMSKEQEAPKVEPQAPAPTAAKEPTAAEYKETELMRKELEALRAKNSELETRRKTREEEEAKKRDEWEKLYKDKTEEYQQLSEKNKKLMIMSEVKLQAATMGLKKAEFLKLFDESELIMDDGGTITGLTTKLEQFQKTYPEFFNSADNKKPEDRKPDVPGTDNSKPNLNRRVDGSNVEQLEAIIKDRSTRPTERKKAIAQKLALKMQRWKK